MGRLTGPDEAEPREGGMVLGQLDPGFQFQCREPQPARAVLCRLHQPAADPGALQIRLDCQLADIEVIAGRSAEDAADHPVADPG